jgi:carbamate kinase
MTLTLLHYQCCLQTGYQIKKLISDAEKEAKAPAFENSQQQVGSVYDAQQSGFGVADASHSYYQVDFLAFHSSCFFCLF